MSVMKQSVSNEAGVSNGAGVSNEAGVSNDAERRERSRR